MSTNNSGTDVSFSTRDKLVINRKHKDQIFRMLFSAEHKDYLLSLYNALHGTHYDNPDDLTITTLEDALFMGMKNDVSFIIDQHAALFEHQSTRNPNMPLRGFIYMARVLQSIIDMDSLDIYSNRLVEIPTPEYYVFYNGLEDCPETEDLYLSDAFKHKPYGHYEGHDRNSDGPFFEC
ncbi:MAG: hypothetical protein Q4B73_10045, partial [Lachnospiraceae bacterium]|nr:hypothetical protein [Lachnospiraceae bacterium]